jgi:L-fucose isomerase-like protein
MALDGLARLLKQRFVRKQVEGIRTVPKVNLVRYADDFIITGSTKELLEKEVWPLVEQFLSDRGLRLSPEKTRITHISHGFDFLGQHLRKFGGKLVIQPSKKNTMGRRIICVGGPSGWACPQAPERARQRFGLDMVTVPIPEINALIESARKDAAVVGRSQQDARNYRDARGVKSQISRDAVAEAFLLKGLFRDLMKQHGACAVTTNACMNSYAGIMPCLTLTLTNDDGYMAYCESDFVNIPAGILMHFIAGRPTYFCNPTFPHQGRMLFAHCTAPRRMDGQKLEPVTLVSHYESDHGAATHVHFHRGQSVTVIKPDFEAKHWLALTGKIVDTPVQATCRAQIEIALDADTQDVIRNMRGFHCQIAYGEWTREVTYAAKKVGIEVQRLSRTA